MDMSEQSGSKATAPVALAALKPGCQLTFRTLHCKCHKRAISAFVIFGGPTEFRSQAAKHVQNCQNTSHSTGATAAVGRRHSCARLQCRLAMVGASQRASGQPCIADSVQVLAVCVHGSSQPVGFPNKHTEPVGYWSEHATEALRSQSEARPIFVQGRIPRGMEHRGRLC
jgi:hypothetical protein